MLTWLISSNFYSSSLSISFIAYNIRKISWLLVTKTVSFYCFGCCWLCVCICISLWYIGLLIAITFSYLIRWILLILVSGSSWLSIIKSSSLGDMVNLSCWILLGIRFKIWTLIQSLNLRTLNTNRVPNQCFIIIVIRFGLIIITNCVLLIIIFNISNCVSISRISIIRIHSTINNRNHIWCGI